MPKKDESPTIVVPDAYADEAYVLPADLTIDQLRTLAEQAQTQALALLPEDESYTDDDLARAQWLFAAKGQITDAISGMETVVAERRAAGAKLRESLAPVVVEEVPEVTEPEVAEVPAAEVTELEPVVAAAKKPVKLPSIADVAKDSKTPVVQSKKGSVTLVAAADVPGLMVGQTITETQLGKAWLKRTEGFKAFLGRDAQYSAAIADVQIESQDDALVASGAPGSNGEVDITAALDYACDEKNLSTAKGSGSLVAAGGWCAPTMPLYDLLNLMTGEGLIDVPGISAPRGGLQWATGPDFTAVYNGGQMFTQTEAQAIAGTAKPMIDIPCPGTQSARMNADGMYLTAGILLQHAWPEAVADFMAKAQIAFQHYISARTIADIVAGSTPVDESKFATFAPPYGAIATVLSAVMLQVEDMKYRGRLSRGQSVEVVMPFFARGILRADLMKRQVTDPTEIVLADAQIDTLFARLGVKPQFVYDWQDAVTDSSTPSSFGAAAAITGWPQTFKVLIYPSGTWARALEPVISLSAIYDSTLLAANKYVALFQEQGRLTIKRAFDSRIVTVSSIPSGVTGGTTGTVAPGSTPPASQL